MYMTFIVKHVYWYVSQISGERLQGHGSSGFVLKLKSLIMVVFSCYRIVSLIISRLLDKSDTLMASCFKIPCLYSD